MWGVKLEVFRDPGFGNVVSGEWISFDIDVNRFLFTHITSLLTVHIGSK